MNSPIKDVSTLNPRDLVDYAVWEFTGREKATAPNEGSVRPRPEVADPSTDRWRRFVVRTTFGLNDGTQLIGHVTPTVRRPDLGEYIIGYLAPAIVTDSGVVPFWFVADSEPQTEDVLPHYERLGRSANDIFPLSFDADVPMSDSAYVASGSLEAFYFVLRRNRGFELLKTR